MGKFSFKDINWAVVLVIFAAIAVTMVVVLKNMKLSSDITGETYSASLSTGKKPSALPDIETE